MKKFKRYKCVNFDDVPRHMDMMDSVNMGSNQGSSVR